MSVSPNVRGPGIHLGGRPADPSRPTPPVTPPEPPDRQPRLSDLENVELDEPRAPGVAPRSLLIEDALGVWRREPKLPVEMLPSDLPGSGDAQPLPVRHVQAQATVRWLVVHNLGYRPHFSCSLSNGDQLVPDRIEHPVPGVTSEIVFGAAFAGSADPS